MKTNFFKNSAKVAATLMFATVMTVGFTACNKNDENQPKEQTKTCLEYLQQDYDTIVKRYPMAEGRFMEARYELNGKVSDLSFEELKAVSVEYWYYISVQDEETQEFHAAAISMEHNLVNPQAATVITLQEASSPWFNDKIIPDFENYISLEEALRNVKYNDCNDPQTRFVTLRYPVIYGLDRGHALYVFGGSEDRDEHVLVDAISGEVVVLDN